MWLSQVRRGRQCTALIHEPQCSHARLDLSGPQTPKSDDRRRSGAKYVPVAKRLRWKHRMASLAKLSRGGPRGPPGPQMGHEQHAVWRTADACKMSCKVKTGDVVQHANKRKTIGTVDAWDVFPTTKTWQLDHKTITWDVRHTCKIWPQRPQPTSARMVLHMQMWAADHDGTIRWSTCNNFSKIVLAGICYRIRMKERLSCKRIHTCDAKIASLFHKFHNLNFMNSQIKGVYQGWKSGLIDKRVSCNPRIVSVWPATFAQFIRYVPASKILAVLPRFRITILPTYCDN